MPLITNLLTPWSLPYFKESKNMFLLKLAQNLVQFPRVWVTNVILCLPCDLNSQILLGKPIFRKLPVLISPADDFWKHPKLGNIKMILWKAIQKWVGKDVCREKNREHKWVSQPWKRLEKTSVEPEASLNLDGNWESAFAAKALSIYAMGSESQRNWKILTLTGDKVILWI